MTFRLLALRRIGALALATVLLAAALAAATVDTAEAATPKEIRAGLQKRINKARTDRGLRALKVNLFTQEFAQDHTRWMAKKGKLIHDSSTALWAEVPVGAWWRAENIGYVTSGAGEARRLHKAFMGSTGHRANILKKRATHIGIGVVKAGGRVWVTERFVDLKP